MNCIYTNMPGTKAPLALASSSRAFSVRVVGLTSGRMAPILALELRARGGRAGGLHLRARS